jgi:type IV secretory pathway VirB2 component (pilin)
MRSPQDRIVAVAMGALGAFFALLSAVMMFGVGGRKPWARMLQIGIAGLGLFFCPYSLASLVVLFYLFRPATKVHFSGRRLHSELSSAEAATLSNDSGDIAFTLALLGTVLIGTVLLIGACYGYTRYADARVPTDVESPTP